MCVLYNIFIVLAYWFVQVLGLIILAVVVAAVVWYFIKKEE